MREANTFDLSLLILLAIIWGSSFFNIKIATYSYDPITLALVRVIFDIPIPDIKYYHKCKMINILGENYSVIDKSLNKKNHRIYIYGKDKIKEDRKLGHINILL